MSYPSGFHPRNARKKRLKRVEMTKKTAEKRIFFERERKREPG